MKEIALISMLAVSCSAAYAVTIPTVIVGNAGNAGQNQQQGTFGAVAYSYRIGTTEVTNAQYIEFLNSVDPTGANALALYSTNMTNDVRGGITFTAGNSDGSKYSAKTNMGDKPVNHVSWYDSIRFANWLHNGQGTGDTETGAYTLGQLGFNAEPINGLSITRNPGAAWFLPSEDEWYKAAYHQPAAQGGDSDSYWLYPTASNSVPTAATADSVGNISNPGANVVNYRSGADWNNLNGNFTTVGSAGPLSDSFYGTADQGGNAIEWNEALIAGSFRGVRGGSWIDEPNIPVASVRGILEPRVATNSHGFRVATLALVPEPSSIALAAVALVGLSALCRRKLT